MIEYRILYVLEFMLKLVVDYIKENGVFFVIDDNFDMLYILIFYFRFMGVEVDFDYVYVIKIGGIYNIGGKVKWIEFYFDLRVFFRNYINVSFEILVEGKIFVINLVFGLENIFMIMCDFRDFY